MGNENHRDKCDRIGCSISRRNVISLGNADKSSERGGGCHSTGKRTKVVKKRKLKNVLGKDVTDDESDSICQGLAYIKMFT